MINYADARITKIEIQIAGIKENGQSILHPDKWDRTFLQLKGIKGFWDELVWDQILIECPELEWVKGVRADPLFREFYKLKTDLDQLLQLKGV